MPRFRIVGRHPQALFHSGLQFVEKGAHRLQRRRRQRSSNLLVHPGGLHIANDQAQFDAVGLRALRAPPRPGAAAGANHAPVHWRFKRQNRQRYRRTGDPLDDIMNRAVSTTGKHCVATVWKLPPAPLQSPRRWTVWQSRRAFTPASRNTASAASSCVWRRLPPDRGL